jgi:thioredoxin 1
MANANVIELTSANFEAVANSGQPVLIDFWAPWCGPCRMLGPVVDEIATLKAGVAKVCKVNVDEEADLAAKFRVTSIPLLVFIKNGQVVTQKVGVQSKNAIIEQLESMA